MRTYGRVKNLDGTKTWYQVNTDADGADDYVWFVTLGQVLLLSRNESPFYGNYGIPAQQSLLQQVFPDYYVAETQLQFAGYFASLNIAKISGRNPTYNVVATFNNGTPANEYVPIPI
jgi:hypothetical protein